MRAWRVLDKYICLIQGKDLPAARAAEAGYVEVGRCVLLLHVVKQHLLVQLLVFHLPYPCPLLLCRLFISL